MADYQKMYAILCGAVDDVIDSLEEIPFAAASVQKLKTALLQAEEIYLKTTFSPEEATESGLIVFPANREEENP